MQLLLGLGGQLDETAYEEWGHSMAGSFEGSERLPLAEQDACEGWEHSKRRHEAAGVLAVEHIADLEVVGIQLLGEVDTNDLVLAAAQVAEVAPEAKYASGCFQADLTVAVRQTILG